MKRENIIVVGAGVAGLATAIRLQHQGHDVTIVEKNKTAGGKMSQIKKDGYTFDLGPTIVMMAEIYEEIFRDVGRKPEDYITLQRIEPMYEVYYDRVPQKKYVISSDLVALTKTLEDCGSKTSQGFFRYLTNIYDCYQIALNHFIRRPFRHPLDFYHPKTIYQALKLKTFDSVNHMMAKYIPNDDIKEIFSFQTLYIGVSPKKDRRSTTSFQ